MEDDENNKEQLMAKKILKDSIEVEGNTVEDAIKRALALLRVERDSVDVKVVCEEQKGLFGMEGAKPAKIKVTLKNK